MYIYFIIHLPNKKVTIKNIKIKTLTHLVTVILNLELPNWKMAPSKIS
jgi:hypothetical protein